MTRNTTQKLCVIAMLTALATVLNAFSIQTQIFSISFIYLTAFFSGVFLGPIVGFAVGAIADIIGFVIALFNGGGGFLPTLTLSSGLMGVLPWCVFRLGKKLPNIVKIILAFLLIFVVCTMGINTLTLYFTFASKQNFLVYFNTRILSQTPTVILNCVIACIVYKPLKNVFIKFGLFEEKRLERKVVENDSNNN